MNYKPDELPIFTDKGIWMRLIAGNAYGLKNDVAVHSPLLYLHVKMDAGAKLNLPTEHSERAVYITGGHLELSGITYSKGQMIVFSKNEEATVWATTNTEFMILGGEPLGERFIWWTLSLQAKNVSSKPKTIGKRGKLSCPPTIIRNLFHFLKTILNQQAAMFRRRNRFHKNQYIIIWLQIGEKQLAGLITWRNSVFILILF